MAFVLRNAVVAIDGNNVSTSVQEVEVAMEAADVSTTAMGAGGEQHLAGIRNDKFTIKALSTFGASNINGIIGAKFIAAGTVEVKVTANGSTVGTSNPLYIGYCPPLTYSPIAGAVGDAASFTIELPVSGTITEATAGTIP